MFSRITILQLMVHRCCVSWADRNVCRPIVGNVPAYDLVTLCYSRLCHRNTILSQILTHAHARSHTHTSCMRAYKHIYICVHNSSTYTHTYTDIYIYKHTFMHAYIQTPYIHNSITYTHACIHRYINTHTHTHTDTSTRTHARARIQFEYVNKLQRIITRTSH